MYGCANNPSDNQLQKQFLTVSLRVVDIPKYSIDTVFLVDHNFNIRLTDTKPYLDPTIYNEALRWYSSQFYFEDIYFDSMRIEIRMPNRDTSTITNIWPRSLVRSLNLSVAHTFFGQFLKDYLELGVLEEVNHSFSEEIEKSFPEQFPNNSFLWGYDSFEILELYFRECYENKPGVGHKLVEELKNSDYLKDWQKTKLIDLISHYETIYKSQTSTTL